MKVVDILPLSKGVFKESLSYFSGETLERGSLVSIPLRKGTSSGIVLRSRTAEEMKSQLRTAAFELKKLGKLHARNFYLPYTLRAAEETAEYFLTHTGSVLQAITPKTILENPPVYQQPETHRTPSKVFRSTALLATEDTRLSHYRSLIREKFAKNESVFILLPSVAHATRFFEHLRRGIEQFSFLLHGKITKKETVRIWREALEMQHPVLIIGTPLILSLPRSDCGVIILERESSQWYKSLTRPLLDFRFFAEALAKALGAHLVRADRLLSVETYARAKTGEYGELIEHKTPHPTKRSLLPQNRSMNEKKEPFQVLADETVRSLHEILRSKKNAFCLAARKGLAPLTICADCETPVVCTRCNATATLVAGRQDADNIFLCRRCGERRSARERCRTCDSWRLHSLGIGTELLEQTLAKVFPGTPIFRLDGDSASSETRARMIAKNFESKQGALLIGTLFAIQFLEAPLPLSVVVSLDSLFSLPDFRIPEKVFSLLLELASRSHKLMVQTRRPYEQVFSAFVAGSIVDFYSAELENRKVLLAPPFGIHIKISRSGESERVGRDMSALAQQLELWNPTLFRVGGKDSRTAVVHLLLSLEAAGWPEKKIVRILRSLPPSFRLEVDPDSLFSLPNSKEFI